VVALQRGAATRRLQQGDYGAACFTSKRSRQGRCARWRLPWLGAPAP